jgi:hypothetical protein
MVAVMIYEIVENQRVTGSPFAFKPFINPMLGPAQIELITLGARWPPCMKTVEAIPLNFPIACANTTSLPATDFCSIETICAFGGFNGQEANQWWRFVTLLPIEYPSQWKLCLDSSLPFSSMPVWSISRLTCSDSGRCVDRLNRRWAVPRS